MVQLLQLAIDCVAQVPEARPSMAHVVVRIEEIKKSSGVAEARDIKEDDEQSFRVESVEAPTNPFTS
jgi:hypothetical protein